MHINDVETFIAVARHGGLTRASEVLHISQPAVTRRLHVLENELGHPLFERIGRGIALSDAGRAFRPYAETILTAVRDGVEAVRDLSDQYTGEVSLAFVGTLASSMLTERLRAFRASHPAVELRLRTSTSDGVSDLVRRGEATLGLRYGSSTHLEMISTPAGDETLMAVAATDHPAATRGDATLDELATHPWLTFPSRPDEPREPYGNALHQLLGDERMETVDLVAIDSLTAQMRMVEAGFGLAVLPESSIRDELRSGRLSVIASMPERPTIPIFLIQRRSATFAAAASALRDALLDVSAPVPSVGGDD